MEKIDIAKRVAEIINSAKDKEDLSQKLQEFIDETLRNGDFIKAEEPKRLPNGKITVNVKYNSEKYKEEVFDKILEAINQFKE